MWGSAPLHAGIPPPSRQSRPPGMETPLARQIPPAQCILGDTVNKRVVCILLECSFVEFISNVFNTNNSLQILDKIIGNRKYCWSLRDKSVLSHKRGIIAGGYLVTFAVIFSDTAFVHSFILLQNRVS